MTATKTKKKGKSNVPKTKLNAAGVFKVTKDTAIQINKRDRSSLTVSVAQYAGTFYWSTRLTIGNQFSSSPTTPQSPTASSETQAIIDATQYAIGKLAKWQGTGSFKRRCIAASKYLESIVVEYQAKQAGEKPSQKKAKPAIVSQETLPAIGPQIVQLATANCKRHPDNRQPTKEAVDDLARSIKTRNQLEPIIVRQLGKDEFEILSGETRWLAQKKLKSKVAARIAYDCSDAAALLMVAAGNAARRDLDPVQRAQLCVRMIDPADQGGAGLTQAQAAELVGFKSRSAVANAVRLLKAPSSILDLVANGRLPETYARAVLPLIEIDPAQMTNLVLSVIPKNGNVADEYSRERFLERVGNQVRDKSRSMVFGKPQYYNAGKCDRWTSRQFKPTKQQAEDLAAFDMPKGMTRHSGNNRTLNVKLWNQLQKEAGRNWKEQSKGKGKKTMPASKKGAAPGKADLQAKEKKRQEQFDRRINTWRFDWLRYLVADRIWSPANVTQRVTRDDTVQRLLLWTSTNLGGPFGMSHSGQFGLLAQREDALDVSFRENDCANNSAVTWDVLTDCNDGQLASVAIEYAARLFWMPSDDGDPSESYATPFIPNHIVASIATQFDIDLAKAWKADRAGPLTIDFFELHTKDQLTQLAKAWKVSDWNASAKTGDMRNSLATDVATKASIPKVLAKMPKAAKRSRRR